MLILNYLHAPAGIPLLRVCGLALSQRAAFEGMENGYQQIVLLVHSQDLPSVADILTEDQRLCDIRLFSSLETLEKALSPQPEVQDGEITLVAADRVWSGTPFAQLHSSDGGIALIDSDGHAVMAKGKAYHFKIENFVAWNSDFLSNLFSTNTLKNCRVENEQWSQVSSADDVEAAEKLLLSSLMKDADGLISQHINRKISLSLTRRLMRTRITPNQVTAIVFAIGACSGPLMVINGGYWGIVAGALLYYLSAILDGCDGELARLKFQKTPLGAWLDTVVDDSVGLSFLLGLYGVLFSRNPLWGWIGLFAISFYLLTLVPRYYVLAVYLGTGDYQQLAVAKNQSGKSSNRSEIIQFCEDIFFRTDFIPFFAFVTCLLNLPEIFAAILVLGCFASSIDSLLTFASFQRISRKRNISTERQ